MNNTQDLLIHELQDLYSAENQLMNALSIMTQAATNDGLKQSFELHLEQTQQHIKRLEKIASYMSMELGGTVCKGMKGLIEEGNEIINKEGDNTIKDIALVGAARKVEHYEMLSYKSAISLAEAMQNDEAVQMLQQTLDEEENTDAKLKTFSQKFIKEISDEKPLISFA
jgi:ferritin-like metal-binding protein YciE